MLDKDVNLIARVVPLAPRKAKRSESQRRRTNGALSGARRTLFGEFNRVGNEESQRTHADDKQDTE